MTLKDAYTLSEFKSLFSSIDEATIDDLYKVFGMREPIENFPEFIAKNEALYHTQYEKLLRDESVEYDAMVTDYIERLTTATENASNTEKSNSSTKNERTGNSNTTLTHNTKNEHIGENSGTTTATGDSNDEGTQNDNKTTSNDSQNLVKSNPFSNTYSVQTGSFPALNWDSSDSQNETKENGSENGATTHSNTIHTTSNGTDTGKESATDTITGTDTTAGTDTVKDTGTGETSKSITSTTKNRNTDRYAGRHGYSPAELLDKSRTYILGTDAFRWLVSKFDRCFCWEIDF